MLAQERITGLPMIEFARGSLPFDDVEVLAEMVGVAARAILLATDVLDHASMKSPAGGEPLPDFGMATQTLKARRPRTKDVAGCALSWAIQIVVCARERTG